MNRGPAREKRLIVPSDVATAPDGRIFVSSVNNAIFANIVRPRYRSTIYSMDRCIEGAMASAGSLIVGVLADEVFHFQRHSPTGGGHGGRRLLTNSTATSSGGACDLNNAAALSKVTWADPCPPP